MKIIDKKQCEYKMGHIVYNGEVIGLPTPVIMQLNDLEKFVQIAEFLKPQEIATPVTMEGYEFQHERETPVLFAEPETPTLNKKAKESMKIAAEIDKQCEHGKLVEVTEEFAELIKWVESDEFIESYDNTELDLKTIGNPLELTTEKIAEYLAELVEQSDKSGMAFVNDSGAFHRERKADVYGLRGHFGN